MGVGNISILMPSTTLDVTKSSPNNTASLLGNGVEVTNAPITMDFKFELNLPTTGDLADLKSSEWAKIIEQVNKKLAGVQTSVEFSVHEETKQILVKVVNSETHEVIREIPPEKILNVLAGIWELAGLLVDERR